MSLEYALGSLVNQHQKTRDQPMTNYQAALQRIAEADTQTKLEKLERSFDTLYNLGQFTVAEFSSLDEKLMDKLIQIGRFD